MESMYQTPQTFIPVEKEKAAGVRMFCEGCKHVCGDYSGVGVRTG